MHLVVDATVAHQDLEGSHVTPGVVPGVDAEPVVLAVLSAPTDRLDSVAAERGASLVRIDTGLVSEEVFVDGESRGDSAVLLDVSLDAINAGEAIAGRRGVLVIGVDPTGVIGAGLGASRLNLRNVVTQGESLAGHMMSTLLHSVVVASTGGTIIATGHDTGILEPIPWSANLATVAAHGEAVGEAAASGGVRD